jgi:hypothetical protein
MEDSADRQAMDAKENNISKDIQEASDKPTKSKR